MSLLLLLACAVYVCMLVSSWHVQLQVHAHCRLLPLFCSVLWADHLLVLCSASWRCQCTLSKSIPHSRLISICASCSQLVAANSSHVACLPCSASYSMLCTPGIPGVHADV